MRPLTTLPPDGIAAGPPARQPGWTRRRLVTLVLLLAGAAGTVAFLSLVAGLSANAVGGCGGG